MMANRAEIDTTAPFRSVKEAVGLFGERVLASELYASRLKQIPGEKWDDPTKFETIEAELEETKHNLKKAKEENLQMKNYLFSLKDELERTRNDLQQLKVPEPEKEVIKDINTKFEKKSLLQSDNVREETEFEKRRFVKFAAAQTTSSSVDRINEVERMMLERNPSLRRKKKMTLIPLIGGFFFKKKASHEVA